MLSAKVSNRCDPLPVGIEIKVDARLVINGCVIGVTDRQHGLLIVLHCNLREDVVFVSVESGKGCYGTR
jgi:hypothetical protein